MKFNEQLRAVLKQKGMTQKLLAEKAGITESAISHYLAGDRFPRSRTIARIAGALNISVDTLLGTKQDTPEAEIKQAGVLIARNVGNMTQSQKLELIRLLAGKGVADA